MDVAQDKNIEPEIRPNSWKSDPQLNQKQVKRIEKNPTQKPNNVITTKLLSKSSDWTEVDLQVPDKEDHVHLPNPKLNLIFNNEKGTPTPPPRKHKKNLREKLEAVAKTGLQAFQSKKQVENVPPKKLIEIEEPACVRKTINYKCPLCDSDESAHNRDHHHDHHTHHHTMDNDKSDTGMNNKLNNIRTEKGSLKRKKNLSVTSLPNYDELKLTVAEFDDSDKGTSALKPDKDTHPSEISLPIEHKKTPVGSTGKLDTYITRCRSFGSIFPQQLKKLRPRKTPTDIESDDSFGGLEDWDLGLIEHYNPKDASLPRPRKSPRNDEALLADIESMIVTEEEIEKERPKPKPRKAESLVKKINRQASEEAHKRSNELITATNATAQNITPPSSPIPEPVIRKTLTNVPTEEGGEIEHSNLIKILEKFSIENKQNKDKNENDLTKNNSSNESSLTPSLVEFEKNLVNSVEDCIKAENINKNIDEKNLNNSEKKIVNEIIT